MLMERLQISWLIVPPIGFVFGLAGNALPLIIVTNKHCKKSSFTTYLAALAIVDAAVLTFGCLEGFLIFGLHVDLSLVLRKPVFGSSDQVGHKLGCSAIEDG